MRSDHIDLTGEKFNRWTVKEFAGKNKHRQALWLCICKCGTERIVRGMGRISSKSCGCLQKEKTAVLSKKRNRTHGESKTPLYRVWSAMKRRCDNPKVREYKWYGGRGITFFHEWTKYEPFKKWAIENGYQAGLTIDRIDSNGNYEPLNCQWVSMEKQQINRRNNIWVEVDGRHVTLAELSRSTGLKDKLLYERYKKGARTVKELTAPKKSHLSINHNGQNITLRELADNNGLRYGTVLKRYRRGKQTIEELTKKVREP